MGHTHIHAPRSAQLGLLAERPSPTRIAAYTSVIALHAAALALLMMPMAAPAPGDADDVVVTPIFVVAKPPEILPVVPPPPTTRPVRVTTRTVAPTTPVPPILVEDSPMAEAYVESPPTEEIVTQPPSINTSPIRDAQLVYASAPPPAYPKEEERRRIEGTVLLQVLVGVDGKPIEVTIQSSSGNRRLDDAARKQVLRLWTFQPAMRGGVPVQAIGLVPISFTVR